MSIKAAVFDLGGVVIEFHPIELTESFGKNKEESQLYLDVIRHPDWFEFDRGTYTKEEIAQKVFERTGSPVSRTMEFFVHLRESFSVIQPTWDFIRELKAKGISIYLLSNMNMDTFNYLKSTFPVFNEFDDGVVSENVGYCKPEKEIFDIFLKQTGLSLDEFIFFDDTDVNVKKATDLNWQVLQYHKYNCLDVQKEVWEMINK